MTKIKGVIPQLGELTPDVWVDERHRRELEITKNPIEYGSPIADHAYIKAQNLGISFAVSNTPLFPSASFTDDDRLQEAREKLYQLQDDKVPLTVKTISGGEYKNMLLVGIGWSTDEKNPHSTIFSLDLEEIEIVTTQKTTYTALPAEPKTKKKTDPKARKGKKPKNKLPSDKKAKGDKKSRAEANAERSAATRGSESSARNDSYSAPQKAKGAAANKQLDVIKRSDNRTQLKKLTDSI